MAESKKTSRTLTQGMKVQTWPELMHNDGDSAAVVAEQRKRFLMELALALADVQYAWDDQSGTIVKCQCSLLPVNVLFC